jgi:precorrin-8X/cobalt-precorrin-8 methylmutase
VTSFDRYVVVDWSAASRPVTGADSIWIAVLDDGGTPEVANPPTRAAAASVLRGLQGRGRRTLVAVDASLGHPAGSAAWFGLDARPPWRAMWRIVSDLLVDGSDNRNNRFEVADALNRRGGGRGPYWGRPAGLELAALATTKPPVFPVGEFRQCELALRERGLRPASGWQLLGAGSVGSQTLTLLPLLDELLVGGGVEIWPFTTGPSPRPLAPGETLVAETWPTLFEVTSAAEDEPSGAVRDAVQVTSVAAALRSADRSHELDGWFTIERTGSDLAAVVDEEGWILGPTPIVGR